MLTGIPAPFATIPAFPALSPEKQKKADAAKQILQQSLDTLKNGKPEINAQRKSAAAARIAQIKQAINAMRQVAGMDPKAMARMLAMLAKQLASAVSEYKAAGGTDPVATGVGSTPVAADSEEAATSQQQGAAAYGKTQNVVSSQSSGKDQDDAFLREATGVFGEMKGMLEAVRQRLKKNRAISGMDPDLRDVRGADKALDEVDGALRTLRAQAFSI